MRVRPQRERAQHVVGAYDLERAQHDEHTDEEPWRQIQRAVRHDAAGIMGQQLQDLPATGGVLLQLQHRMKDGQNEYSNGKKICTASCRRSGIEPRDRLSEADTFETDLWCCSDGDAPATLEVKSKDLRAEVRSFDFLRS